MLTKTGRTRSRVRRTVPTRSPRCRSGALEPRARPISEYPPTRMLFAQPIAGIPVRTPRWQARPKRRGWASPWPSHSNASHRSRQFRKRREHRRGFAEGQQARNVGEGERAADDPLLEHPAFAHRPRHCRRDALPRLPSGKRHPIPPRLRDRSPPESPVRPAPRVPAEWLLPRAGKRPMNGARRPGSGTRTRVQLLPC